MNISVCITVKNEEGSIGRLLDSLLGQTKKPDEIVIVDGGSTDKTVEIINHYQKKFSGIRLLKEKCTRGKGRNLAVEVARGKIIAMTDAGCVARNDWLEKITEPLIHLGGNQFTSGETRLTPEVSREVHLGGVQVVAGFYKMIAKNSMQKAMRVFLGTLPRDFNIGFLPSTRSIAFRKSIWEKVRGFPEEISTAEDTVFNYKLIKNKAKISRVKDAVVEWGMPTLITNFYLSIFNYARGDAKSKIWIFPGKDLASHNIKAIFIILRYLIGLGLLISLFWFPYLSTNLIQIGTLGLFVYLLIAARKAGLWGILFQLVTDFAVMRGFIAGLCSRPPRRKPSATVRGVRP